MTAIVTIIMCGLVFIFALEIAREFRADKRMERRERFRGLDRALEEWRQENRRR